MQTTAHQPGILAPVPVLGRYLEFDLSPGADPRPVLAKWREVVSPEQVVIGIGEPLALALAKSIPGLRTFPAVSGPGCEFPSTQRALWVFAGASDASELHDRVRAIHAVLRNPFLLREEVPAFRYREGRDLTGYEDGTENPKDELAAAAALVASNGEGLDGSSFVAVQRWIHDLKHFSTLPGEAQDALIGRHRATNEELPDAPESAHVKRTAQEDFDPPAFMVRRSMPWGGVDEHGLYFVAYGESLDRFERVLIRMSGREDGIVDGLLRFSRAVTGGYYWCPPLAGGRVDWSALGV